MNKKNKLMQSLPKITLISTFIIVCLVTAGSIGALSGTNNATPKSTTKDTNSNSTVKSGVPAVYIGDAAAKEIVMAKAPGVTINEFHFEFDDGVAEYDGEATLDSTKYEFEINAVTGVITEWKIKVKAAVPTTGTTPVYITEEAAKNIVLAKIPGATISEMHLDSDDGKAEYDGKAYLDTTKYEFEIDAVTGEITEWESEAKKQDPKPAAVYIGKDAAIAIALAKVPGATITEICLEHDDGHVEYDGEMYLNNTEYDFSIDAVTGAITDWEVEVDDDTDEEDTQDEVDDSDDEDED